MRASLHLEVALDAAGTPRVQHLRGEPPLVARVACDTDGTPHLWMVGAAAGPLGGDDLSVEVVVHAGARLVVRSVAAMIALPGPHGEPSSLAVHLHVGPDAALVWSPEPMVVAARAMHHQTTSLTVEAGGQARVVERTVLGRCDEPAGAARLRQRLVHLAELRLDHEATYGPGVWSGSGAQGTMRCHHHELIVGVPTPPSPPECSVDALGALVDLGGQLTVGMAQARSMADLDAVVGRWPDRELAIARKPRRNAAYVP